MHIGVLEDDLDQQAFIELCLLSVGHSVSLFARASELRRATQQQAFDFFIIDWRLPDSCGMDVVTHLRQHDGWQGPILFITASQGEDDVVKALEQGRRSGYEPPRPASAYPDIFTLHTEKHYISLAGSAIDLTEREYRLAALFFSKIGELITRAHLLEVVWGIKGDVSTRTVDTHVSRLRRKLELDGRHGLRLRSVYQSGYRMEACQITSVEQMAK